jgi:hypothetical protein
MSFYNRDLADLPESRLEMEPRGESAPREALERASAGPKTARRPRHWVDRLLSSPIATLVVVGVAAAASAAVLLGDNFDKSLGALNRDEYVSTPFFSTEGLNLLEPGMTEDEVRDRIGYPLFRHWSGQNIVTVYTAPGDGTRFPHCTLSFDPDADRLEVVRYANIPNYNKAKPTLEERYVREARRLYVQPESGEPYVLESDDSPMTVFVLLGDATVCATEAAVARAEAVVEAHRAEHPEQPVELESVICLYPADRHGRATGHEIRPPEGRGSFNPYPCVTVWKDGLLYRLGVDTSRIPTGWPHDLAWLLRRLGE